MRKRLTLAVAMAASIALAVSGVAAAVQSPVLTGPNGNTQSIGIKFSPQKLPKAKAAPVTLDVSTATTTTTNPNGVPVPAVQAIVDFPKDVKLFSKGYPSCSATELENTSAEVALSACKAAEIGGGEGTALLPVGTKVFPVTTTITAFNGAPQGGKPVILLHTYSEVPIQTTLVLVGVVTNYGKEGYGPRLTVTIPLIGGGAGAITGFHVNIFKTFNYKGQKRSYVSATCKTRKLKTRGEFVFKDGVSLAPVVTQKCAQKPERKGK